MIYPVFKASELWYIMGHNSIHVYGTTPLIISILLSRTILLATRLSSGKEWHPSKQDTEQNRHFTTLIEAFFSWFTNRRVTIMFKERILEFIVGRSYQSSVNNIKFVTELLLYHSWWGMLQHPEHSPSPWVHHCHIHLVHCYYCSGYITAGRYYSSYLIT